MWRSPNLWSVVLLTDIRIAHLLLAREDPRQTTQGKVRALVASVSQIFVCTPPCMREDGPMDMAEYICESGDGMGVNLLDRPAEQIGVVFDRDLPDHAATVNTIRRGLREFGLSA